MLILALSYFFLLVVAGTGLKSTGANLLISKHFKEEYIVQGRNLSVTLKLHNVGNSPAYNVDVYDKSFQQFQLVGGSFRAKFDEIPVAGNVSYTYVVVPPKNITGRFLDNPATVSYLTEKDGEPQFGSSSSYLYIFVLTEQEYLSNFAEHGKTWTIYFAAASLPILIPFLRHMKHERVSEFVDKKRT